MSFSITRYHDICCGHRVVGHEGKCRHLHGHNYRLYFEVRATPKVAFELKEPWMAEAPLRPGRLDDLGRVVDFSVIKSTICEWLEENWDHRFVIWQKDPLVKRGGLLNPRSPDATSLDVLCGSIVLVPFNPTAENIARHLVEVIGPELLPEGIELYRCTVQETRKCSATYTKELRNA